MAKIHTFSPNEVAERCEIIIKEIEEVHAGRYEKRIKKLMEMERWLPWLKKLTREQAIKYIEQGSYEVFYLRPYRYELTFAQKMLNICSSGSCKEIILTEDEFIDIFCYKYIDEEDINDNHCE